LLLMCMICNLQQHICDSCHFHLAMCASVSAAGLPYHNICLRLCQQIFKLYICGNKLQI
jgi:hypothetical protein